MTLISNKKAQTIVQLVALCIMYVIFLYVMVMGMDKQAEINEKKAESWRIERQNAQYERNIESKRQGDMYKR